MSRWIKVKKSEIISLSFGSIWYRFQVPHRIDAFDYGNCKIKIRKLNTTKKEIKNKKVLEFE